MTIPVHLCSKCETRPATVKVVKLSHGTASQVWLCSTCAASESPYSALGATPSLGGLPSPAKSLEDVLAGFLGQGGSEGAARVGTSHSDKTCDTCGLPVEAYRSTLLLGCPDCYRSFADTLKADLRKFHGAVQHKGRGPDRPVGELEPPRKPQGLPEPDSDPITAERDLEELRRRLRAAVDEEDYRRAAELKNQIRALEAQRDEAIAASRSAGDQGDDEHGD